MQHTQNTRSPFAVPHNFYILVETSGSNQTHDTEKFSAFLDHCLSRGLVSDGVLAQDSSQALNFWRIRENTASSTLKAAKYLFKFDVSVRISEMYGLVLRVRERIGDLGQVMGYGHVGDGNLHLTIASERYAEVKEKLYPFVYEEVQKLSGSISAEHGIGAQKRGMLRYSRDENSIRYMVSGM